MPIFFEYPLISNSDNIKMIAVEIVVSVTELLEEALHIVAHFDKDACGGGNWLAERLLIGTENAAVLELESQIPAPEGHISYFVVVWGLLKNDSDVHFCRRIQVPLRDPPATYEASNYTIRVATRQHPVVRASAATIIRRPSLFDNIKYYRRVGIVMHRDYGVAMEREVPMLMEIDDPIFGKATVLSQLLDCMPTQSLPSGCWEALGRHYMMYCSAIGKQMDPLTEWARMVCWIPTCCFDYRSDTAGMDDARTALAFGNGDCEDMVIAFLQCLHMFQAERFIGTDPVSRLLERMRVASLKYAVGFGIVQIPSAKRGGRPQFHTTGLGIPREATNNAILRRASTKSTTLPVLVIDCTTVLQITTLESSLPLRSKWRKLRQVNRVDSPNARKYYKRWYEFYTDTHIRDRRIGGFEFINRRRRGVSLEQLLRGEFRLLPHPAYSADHLARAQMESRFRVPAICLSTLIPEVPIYSTEIPTDQTPIGAGWLSNREIANADEFLASLRSEYMVLTIRQSIGFRRLGSTLVLIYHKPESGLVAHAAVSSGRYLASAGMKCMRPQSLEGGIGDHIRDEDVDPKELKMGIVIEMEHIMHSTTLSLEQQRAVARDIAMDHLAEIPDYYTRLAKMEKEALSQW